MMEHVVEKGWVVQIVEWVYVFSFSLLYTPSPLPMNVIRGDGIK